MGNCKIPSGSASSMKYAPMNCISLRSDYATAFVTNRLIFIKSTEIDISWVNYWSRMQLDMIETWQEIHLKFVNVILQWLCWRARARHAVDSCSWLANIQAAFDWCHCTIIIIIDANRKDNLPATLAFQMCLSDKHSITELSSAGVENNISKQLKKQTNKQTKQLKLT